MRGSITRRGKAWRLRFDFGRDAKTGKRKIHSVTVHGKRADADAAMRELLSEHGDGLLVEPSRETFGDYLTKRWLPSRRVSEKTLERQREIVEKHLIPALGHHELQKLRVQHIDAYYQTARMSGRRDGQGGLGERTLLHHHRIVFGALRHAVAKRALSRNVAEAADVPKPADATIRALDEDQTARVIEAAEGSTWHVPIMLAATTGLRRGEVLGLRWRDVALDTAQLRVEQALQQIGKTVTTKTPKTKESRRTIELPTIAVEALRRHRAAQAAARLALGLKRDDEALVFADINGAPLRPSNMTKAFERIAAKAGVKGVSLHALRHSHASQLVRLGFSVKVIQERLGHSSAKTTLDLYVKTLDGMHEAAATAIDKAMRTALQRSKPAS